MDTNALLDMHAGSPSDAGARAEGIHIRKSPSAHVIINAFHFWHLIVSAHSTNILINKKLRI